MHNNSNIEFNGFSFPIIPCLEYLLDGPDKKMPDRIFIKDPEDRFMFYFETGNNELPTLNDHDYQKIEVNQEGRRLIMLYPEQIHAVKKQLGYFKIEFIEKGIQCAGQLIINDLLFLEGLRKYEEIFVILKNLNLSSVRQSE